MIEIRRVYRLITWPTRSTLIGQHNTTTTLNKLCHFIVSRTQNRKQESPAVTDKPARRQSMPKIAPIRRAYNVFADNTGLSLFV